MNLKKEAQIKERNFEGLQSSRKHLPALLPAPRLRAEAEADTAAGGSELGE